MIISEEIWDKLTDKTKKDIENTIIEFNFNRPMYCRTSTHVSPKLSFTEKLVITSRDLSDDFTKIASMLTDLVKENIQIRKDSKELSDLKHSISIIKNTLIKE